MKKILSIVCLLMMANTLSMVDRLQSLNATLEALKTTMTGAFIINGVAVHIVVGDIITFPVQAVVNAANTGLRGGGGIDGYLYAQAGQSKLRNEMNQRYPTNEIITPQGKRPVQPGDAVFSSSQAIAGKYKKTIKRIIHAIGPDCTAPNEKANAQVLLYNAHMNSLIIAAQLAHQNHITSFALAFPVISGAIFACPIALIAQQAAKAVYDFTLNNKTPIKDIYFVMYDQDPTYKEKEAQFIKAFRTIAH